MISRLTGAQVSASNEREVGAGAQAPAPVFWAASLQGPCAGELTSAAVNIAPNWPSLNSERDRLEGLQQHARISAGDRGIVYMGRGAQLGRRACPV